MRDLRPAADPTAGAVPDAPEGLWEEISCAHGPEEPIEGTFSACRLLVACAAEARRLVVEVSALDSTVAEALSDSARSNATASLAALLARSLQGLDRLCQEIDGLAQVLALLADSVPRGGTVSGEDLLAAVRLGAQRRRLLGEGAGDRDR